jgi:excisionase family DNA binding protein
MTSSPASNRQGREFFHAQEIARWCGLPRTSFDLYVAKGWIPSVKIGRHRLFRKAEIIAALEKLRTASTQEILS